MAIICYETEGAIFEFDHNNIVEKLTHYAKKEHIEEAHELLDIIANPTNDKITISEEFQFIVNVLFDLIRNDKGSAKCKICDKTYQPRDLRIIDVGHGKNPLDLKISNKKQKLPGVYGSKGYTCPENHQLITMVTWRT